MVLTLLKREIAIWMTLAVCVFSMDAACSDVELILAVKNGDLAGARSLVEEHEVDVDAAQPDGATALHWAAHLDDLEMAALLVESGADVGVRNDFGVMPLSLACTRGSARMIEILLEAGADPNASLVSGETALMTAARTGVPDAVRVLVDHGADLDAQEPRQNQTALMWAISEKHTAVALFLIERGADIHAATKGGFTPLLFAVRQGELKVAKALADGGADVDTQDGSRRSALHIAVHRGHSELALFLLDEGADPNADGPGYTPLHWASGTWTTDTTGPQGIVTPPEHEWSAMTGVQHGKLELVRSMLEHGADPDARLLNRPLRYGLSKPARNEKINDATPFMLAALAGETDIMRLLLEYGADPLARTQFGITALMLASGVNTLTPENAVPLSDMLDAAELCIELGADVNAQDTYWGHVPLHGAARLKSVEMVRLLVDHGAEVNVVSRRGQTPLYLAERYWRQSGGENFQPSEAGDLLRELTVPETVSWAVAEWGSLSTEVRDKIESLLLEEREKLAERDTAWLDALKTGDPIYPAGCRIHMMMGGVPSFAKEVSVTAFRGEVDLSEPSLAMYLEPQEGQLGIKRYDRRLSPDVLLPGPGTWTVVAMVVDPEALDPEDSLWVAYTTVTVTSVQTEDFAGVSFESGGKGGKGKGWKDDGEK